MTKPEERAKALAEKVFTSQGHIFTSQIDAIAQAITQAENDKLEEAAAHLIEISAFPETGSITVGMELTAQGAHWAAGHIRSLKKD